MKVEQLKKSDQVEWQALYKGYADFYQMPMDEKILDTVWSRIFDEAVDFHVIIVKSDEGRAAGFMYYRQIPSPLRGSLVGFLDDLYVHPEFRGKGVVQALFKALKVIAKDKGWPFIRWITATDNQRARAVYDKISTTIDFVTYQMPTD